MDSSDIHFGLFEKGENNKNIPTHLESVSFELTFHNILIDCKSIQKFTNRSEKHVELFYKFRSASAPHEMKVTLFDPETGTRENLVAKIQTKKKAAEKYDDAIASGSRGVLMEKDEDMENLYILSLGNVKPKMEIEITTKTVSTATLETYDENPDMVIFLHSIPAMIPDDFDRSEELEKNMSVTILAKNAKKVTCPSHSSRSSLTNIRDGHWKTQELVMVNEDFEIEVTYEKYPFSTLFTAPISYKNYKYAGILSLIPNFAAQIPSGQELILIVDCSGSMSGSRMTCAVETLRLFLQSLDADRNLKYNIIRFGSRYEQLFDTPVPLSDDENFEKAKEYVKNMSANLGGTNMYEPIQSIFKKDNDSEGTSQERTNKQLFLFTDGEDSYPKEIQEYLKKMHRQVGVRVFSFGIGKGINRSFLQNCADLTRGSACFIENIRVDMKSQVLRQLSNAFRASIDEIEITKGLCDFGTENRGGGVKRAIKNNDKKFPNSLFNGRSHHEYFFLKQIPEEIEVSYSFLGVKSLEKVKKINLLSSSAEEEGEEEGEGEGKKEKEVDQNSSCVGVRVANEMVNCFLGNDQEVEEIGLTFHIPTKHTSFVMVSDLKNEEEENKIVSEMAVEEVRFSKKKKMMNQNKYSSGYTTTTGSSSNVDDDLDELNALMMDLDIVDLPQQQQTIDNSLATLDRISDTADKSLRTLGSTGERVRNNSSITSTDDSKKKSSGGGSAKGGWLSGLGGFFGGSKKKKKKQPKFQQYGRSSEEMHLQKNMEQIEMLQKRGGKIQEKITSELEKAKKFARSGNKKMAKKLLTKKKQLEGQLNQVMSQVANKETLNMKLEETLLNREVMKVQSSSNSSMTKLMSCMDPVDEMMEDVKDTLRDAEELRNCLGDDMEGDLYQDDLLDELEELESMALDEDLMSLESVVSVPQQKISSQKEPPKKRRNSIQKKEKEEEEEENVKKNTTTTDVKGSVSIENLNQLLLESDMRGCWKCTLKVLRLIGYHTKEMFLKDSEEQMKKYGCPETIWFTAVIVAILGRFYKKKKSEWKLITWKSMKKLRKLEKGDEIIEGARLFVHQF